MIILSKRIYSIALLWMILGCNGDAIADFSFYVTGGSSGPDTVTGIPNGGSASTFLSQAGGVQSVAVDPSGNVWTVATGTYVLTEYSPAGQVIKSMNPFPLNFPQLTDPNFTFDSQGNIVLTAGGGIYRINSATGQFLDTYNYYPGSNVNLGSTGIAAAPNGNIYYYSYFPGQSLGLVGWSANSSTPTVLATLPYAQIFSIATDAQNNIYVGENTSGDGGNTTTIEKYSPTGQLLGTIFSISDINGSNYDPLQLQVDPAGNVYAMMDVGANFYPIVSAQIMEFSPGGQLLSTFATNAPTNTVSFAMVGSGPLSTVPSPPSFLLTLLSGTTIGLASMTRSYWRARRPLAN
jgi:streptogramin lyase